MHIYSMWVSNTYT